MRERASESWMRVAERQFGLLSRAQALAGGLGIGAIDHRLKTGSLIAVHHAVYGVAGIPPSWERRVMAACLRPGGALASHRAAARLFGLLGFDDAPVEITTTARDYKPGYGLVIHRTQCLPPDNITRVGAIPATDINRTLCDLGAVASDQAVEVALDGALRRRLTTMAELRSRLAQVGRRGRRGVGILRRLVAAREVARGVPESVLETRFLRLLRDAGLPAPVAQFVVEDQGEFIARVDFAYPELMLAIEIDGYRYHSGRVAWQRDRERQNRLVCRGWQVLCFSNADLRGPSCGRHQGHRTGSPTLRLIVLSELNPVEQG